MNMSPKSASAARQPAQSFCNSCQRPVAAEFLYEIAGCKVVRCPDCKLVYVPPESVSQQSLPSLYSKEYFEGGLSDGYADYDASEDILRLQARRILRVIRKHRPSGALLEIGCAYGFFLLEAKQFFDIQGIEISSFASLQAQKRQLPVACGDFLAASYPDAHFDVVCLFDCIEHLADPFGYLQHINRVLRPGGLVVMTTGDIESLYARISGKQWRLMTPPQHLFYFSRRTLPGMLQKSGFDLLDLSYPWKLVPWRLILYQISPKLKNTLGRLGDLPLGIYVNLFDAMLVVAQKRAGA